MSSRIEAEVLTELPQGATELMEKVLLSVCALEGLQDIEVGARLVDGGEIRKINREFRGIDRETDVLSFPSVTYPAGRTAGSCPRLLKKEKDSQSGRIHLGDFVISVPRAREQAALYGHGIDREIGYLTAHALLHLSGYDHEGEADKRRMREMEERAMESLHLAREGE